MGEVTESDWKLFKELLPKWQESYMEMLIGQYIEILNGGSEASSRFWALEERINRDKLSSGVLVNDIRRSTMRYELANLLSDNVITLDDLDGFTNLRISERFHCLFPPCMKSANFFSMPYFRLSMEIVIGEKVAMSQLICISCMGMR